MSNGDLQFNRTPIYISLALALALVVAVLVGARIVGDRAAHQPVSLAEVPSPDADSTECSNLLDQLPDSVADHQRVGIVDPVPAGTAVWAEGSDDRVILRCGIEAPQQFTTLSVLAEQDGTEWLRVNDTTTGQSTWFSVNRAPMVAVTTDGDEDPREDLAEALATLPTTDPTPAENPVAAAETPHANTTECQEILADLPDFDGYAKETLGTATVAWRPTDATSGLTPLAFACGTDMPLGFTTGSSFVRVNGVDWYPEESVYYSAERSVVAAFTADVADPGQMIAISETVREHSVATAASEDASSPTALQ